MAPPTLLLAALAAVPAQSTVAQGGSPGGSMDPEALRSHLEFLTSEELAGRGAGTPGAERAAAYVEQALRAAGFRPGFVGPDGPTFRQGIEALRFEHQREPRLVLTTRTGEEVQATYGADFTLRSRGRVEGTERLEILRISDPKHAPDGPSPDRALLFRLSSPFRKTILRDAGRLEPHYWGLELVPQGKSRRRQPLGRPQPRLVFDEQLEDGFDEVQLFGQLAEDMIWRKYTHVRLDADERVSPAELVNVVGVLPGSDPEHAREAILVEVAYDGRGVVYQPHGEVIHAGASAAASVSALLEVAAAFGRDGAPPRTLVFLFDAGRSYQRVGLRRYLDAPAHALDGTVAALLLDPMGRVNEEDGVGALSLAPAGVTGLAAAATARGLPLVAKRAGTRSGRQACDLLDARGVAAQTLGSPTHDPGRGNDQDQAEAVDLAHLAEAASNLRAALGLLADPASVPGAAGR